MSDKKKKTKTPKTPKSSSKLEDYLHKKPKKWTWENGLLFVGYAVAMSFIPARMI